MAGRVLAVCAGFAVLLASAPAAAQDVICCMRLIGVKGKWIGALRDCGGTLAKLDEKQRALGRLRAFQSSLRALGRCIGRQAFAPLSPWLARVSREAQPRELLLHLVKQSRNEFGRFGKSLDQLANSAEATLTALQNIPPDTGK